ncbi:MAG: acetyltransferase [Acidobacteria bacterium]|nr:acetyltransferase [Acidobacteriota bacterium]
MKKVVIIGSGGHGREIAEILQHQAAQDGTLMVQGFLDENPARHGQVIDDLPILGDWAWFETINKNEVAVICAVGTPAVARRLVQRARAMDLSFVNALSPLAHISPRATLGQGIVVFPHVVVNTGAHIGSYSTLNLATTVSHDTKIGEYCNLNPSVHLAGNVTIGNGCYIGMGTNVIQGKSIGDDAIVGAGAVVIRDLPANVTAVGIPAKIIKTNKE